jgi:MYXO-CTERM domain-containing protein
VVWTGDIETGDTSQWNYVLNGDDINFVQTPVAQGIYAAEITLTNDDTWPGNGLHRVELQHLPTASRTAEGAETYFAWSFYLPATLPTDPTAQIGYWESQNSYQQMMAFTVAGENLRFVTRQPSNQTHLDMDGIVTAQTWHRIAMRVLWSKDEAVGLVDVWFDGSQVVANAAAKTLNDDNPHFTQVGLLRGTDAFTDAPMILIDDAVEGDTLEDVRHDALSAGTGGAGGSMGGTGGAGATGAGGGTSSTGGSGSGNGGGGGSIGGINPVNEEDGGCSFSAPRESSGVQWLLAFAGLAGIGLRRRRTQPHQR